MLSYTGVLSLVFATFIYGLYGVFSRMIGIEFGVFAQSTIKNLIVVILSLLIVLKYQLWKTPQKQDWPWIIMWVCGDLAATIGIFIAFNKISIGTAYLLFYAGSLVAGSIIGRVIFQEKLSDVKSVSIVLSLLGLFIIYSLNIEASKLVFLLLAFLSGNFVAVYNTFSKKFSHKYHQMQLVFLNMSISFIISLFLTVLLKENPPVFSFSIPWLGVFLFALSYLFTVPLLIYGFRKNEVQIGSLIMPLEVVFGSIFGLIFYKETLSVSMIIGGLLIIIASVLPNLTHLT